MQDKKFRPSLPFKSSFSSLEQRFYSIKRPDQLYVAILKVLIEATGQGRPQFFDLRKIHQIFVKKTSKQQVRTMHKVKIQ